MSLRLALNLLLPLAGLATACGTTSITVTRRSPAEINLRPGTAVAVATLEGEGGDLLAEDLTQALVGTQRFQVVERRRLDAALQELQLSASGHVSDDTAMSFGNMTGAQTLVIGRVVRADHRETLSERTESCMKDDGMGECQRRTRTAVAELVAALQVIETESGRVLAAKSFEEKEERSTEAVDAEPPLVASREELLRACRAALVRRFVAVVSPHDKQVQVVLLEDGDLPELETGNNFARIGNWESASERYQSALVTAEQAPLSPEQIAKALYNLGVALGYSGAFDEGIDHIERAYGLDPDPLYHRQRDTLRAFKDEDARLRAQEGGG